MFFYLSCAIGYSNKYHQKNMTRYPVWASLARDYLAIQSTSVSSERAFSQGGITISKRRSRLKGDVVEALQVLKCMLRNDLIFREPPPSSISEQIIVQADTEEDDTAEPNLKEDGKLEAWDLLLDDDDEELFEAVADLDD